jgi:methionyl-tRNA synthetase
MGTTDSDFAEAKFIDVYNGDLANGIGNCFNRIANMTNKYFGGEVPEHGPDVQASHPYHDAASNAGDRYNQAMATLSLEQACAAAQQLVGAVDQYIEQTQPFKLAKDEQRLPEVGTILYNCTEAIRIASLLLWPVIPDKMEELWRRLQLPYATQLSEHGAGVLDDWLQWGRLHQDQQTNAIEKGSPLFPRQELAKS